MTKPGGYEPDEPQVPEALSDAEELSEEEFTFAADSPSDEEGFLISEEEQAETSVEETEMKRRRAA
jgi:hypothetical protein